MRKAFLTLPFFWLLAISQFSPAVFAQTTSPHLSLSPTVKEVDVGDTFNVTVSVDTGESTSVGVDAIVDYDSTLLEVASTQEGSFFPTVTTTTATAGKVKIYGVTSSDDPKSGSGTLATITFEATAAGTANVSFTCQADATTDSNINDTNDEDVIVCSENVSASYVISESAGDTTTTTTTPTATPTTTESENLPETGFLEPTLMFLGGGIFLVILGFGLLI